MVNILVLLCWACAYLIIIVLFVFFVQCVRVHTKSSCNDLYLVIAEFCLLTLLATFHMLVLSKVLSEFLLKSFGHPLLKLPRQHSCILTISTQRDNVSALSLIWQQATASNTVTALHNQTTLFLSNIGAQRGAPLVTSVMLLWYWRYWGT